MEIKKEDLKDGQQIWACGYATNNTEKSMAYKKKPVLGIIEKQNGNWRTGGGIFYELGKNRKPKKSSGVSLYARHFANTEEESKEIYNKLVQRQIDRLQKLIDDTKADFIE